MFKTPSMILLIAALFLSLSCARHEDSINDADLALAVRQRFEQSPDIRGATSRVQVQAKEGTITLSGDADTAKDKSLAETLAGNVRGVKSVVNQITVTETAPASTQVIPGAPESFNETAVRQEAIASGERVGEGSEDVRIYYEVRRRIIAEPAAPKRAIFIDVVNGDVTLRGMISTVKARDVAVTAAKGIKGVKAVRDLLQINSPAP